MKMETIYANRSTFLRKTNSQKLKIRINKNNFKDIFLINGKSFITKVIVDSDLTINPNSYYMIINNGNSQLDISYNQNISKHEIIYDPYKYESIKRENLKPEFFIENYNIPDGHIDTLPKWYSFKFTYPNYNYIFIRPEFGLSIQIHKYRNEFWEVLEGKPIIINGNRVHYFVENNIKFNNPIGTYHSVINPNSDRYVIIKENWNGHFDEEDISRVFNPNQYK